MKRGIAGFLLTIFVLAILCVGLSSPGGIIRWPSIGSPFLTLICYLPLAFFVSLWVMQDAQRHRQPGCLWGLISMFVLFPVGTIIYLIFGRD